jgi:glycosyltransferase involved in cell wall biosynthesis
MLRDKRPDARFLLIGEGPESQRLTALAHELGLWDAVHFAGARDDVRPYLAAMDVFLMSSEFEGLPIALLEAMAMERACVVTAVGGIPELVRNCSNGLVLPPADPAKLAEAALSLVDAPVVRTAYGREARRTVVDDFSLQRMTRRLEQLYCELVEKSHRAN